MELKELFKKSLDKVLVLMEEKHYFDENNLEPAVVRYCNYEPSKIIKGGKIIFNGEVDEREFYKVCEETFNKYEIKGDCYWSEFMMLHKMVYFEVYYHIQNLTYVVKTTKGQEIGKAFDLVGCKVLIQEFLKDFKVKVAE